MAGQDDHPPLTPTSAWRAGDAFSEAFVLPAISGQLEVGAYDQTGRRIQWDGAGDRLLVELPTP